MMLGIWGGATTFTASPGTDNNNVFTASNWTRVLRFNGNTGSSGSTGKVYAATGNARETAGFNVGPSNESAWYYDAGVHVFALRYDVADNKLKLYEVSTGMPYEVAVATAAQDGNPVTISAAFGMDSGTPGDTAIPQFTQRDMQWNYLHRKLSTNDTNWRDGTNDDDVLIHPYTLRPGYKFKFTTPSGSGNHVVSWHMLNYTGGSVAQANPQDSTTAALKYTSTAQFTASDHQGSWTTNTSATRYSAAVTTSVISGVLLSWRYHATTNVFDLYDEGNNEVLFTLDDALDGNPISMIHCHKFEAGSSFLPQGYTLDVHDDLVDDSNHGLSGLTQGAEDWFTHVGPRAGLWAWNRSTGNGGDTSQWFDQPLKYNRQLRPGESFSFNSGVEDTSTGFVWIGIFTGTTPYQDRVDTGKWSKYIKFDDGDINAQHGFSWATTTTTGQDGLDYTFNYRGNTAHSTFTANGFIDDDDTCEIEYRASDNKLYVWQTSHGPNRVLMMVGTAAEDGNPITLSATLTDNGAKFAWLPARKFWPCGHAWYTKLAKTGNTNYLANTSYTKNTIDNTYTPVRWGRVMHPGDELVWTHSNQRNDSQAHHFGLIKSSVTTPGSMSNVSNWDRKFACQGTKVESTLGVDGTVGFDIDTFVATTLASNVAVDDTTLTLTDATDYPAAGSVVIDSETITYTAKSGNVLTCAAATATHSSGASVTKAGFAITYNVDQLTLRYNEWDNKLRLYKTTGTEDQLITTATSADSGALTICLGGNGPNMPDIVHRRTPRALGSGVSRWYTRHGARPGRGLGNAIDHGNGADTPTVWGQRLTPGHELVWTHHNDLSGTDDYHVGKWDPSSTVIGSNARATANYIWQIRFEATKVKAPGGGTTDSIGIDLPQEIALEDGTGKLALNGTDGSQADANSHIDLETSDYMDNITGGTTKFALRYDHVDNKVKLYDVTDDKEIFITSTTTAEDGNAIEIATAGKTNIQRIVMAQSKRMSKFTIVREVSPGHNENVRGDHWSDGITAYTIFKGNQKLRPGEALRWRLPQTAQHFHQTGIWNESTNPSLGYNNTATDSHWDWDFYQHNSERIYEQSNEDDWTMNPGATGAYTGGQPHSIYYYNNGHHKVVEIRYYDDNSMVLYSVTNQQVLFTKKVNADGEPMTIWYGVSADAGITSTHMADDFWKEHQIIDIQASEYLVELETATDTGHLMQEDDTQGNLQLEVGTDKS